ncbi:hypothetical protein GUITHDRAFT_155891 [Guillardia theta CCMP2712]|uniref:MD-2-related lipid-recognition domain-containing protein n=1 Tax=Guillardia theta (strain CCMP2712) TaxID=905079 RepID=L1ICF7_GUITC|nr:hypothetical protein GUITHDRAFT_155891 [Guillardia theta CCMP2712]EKX33931.1 hypothetical protein GUITHDRAFT_155891 [Guillardia theta CCMP2712]|eukprot:XP_005820911.1 hypothetical protein GUITHDRAFT_155891 [Guillardia theta CCMP2712]
MKISFCVLLLHLYLTGAIPIRRGKLSNSSAVAPSSWSDCGGGATSLSVNNVKVSPDPVVAGKNFTLSLDCSTSDQVSDGTFVIQVYLAGIMVHKQTNGICEEHSCPFGPGPVNLVSTTNMPIITPHGRYDVKVTGSLPDGLPAICADIQFSVV